jgi:uncharacterized metal-binding protein
LPDGKTHDTITVVGAVVAAPVWWYLTREPRDYTVCATLVGSILFSGLMLSPDLDLDSSIYRRWGPFRFVWWPYQKIVPHRSVLSHSLLGALLRVAYFLAMVWGLSHLLSWGVSATQMGTLRPLDSPLALFQNLYQTERRHLETGIIGLLIGTLLHTGADTVVSGLKRKRRRR